MSESSVQIDNGNYARIHNEILEKLACTDLHASEYRCINFLLRRTYGWGKPKDDISYSQWEEGTKLNRRTLRRTLSNLTEKRIFVAADNGNNRPKTWNFNKYFDQWNLTITVRTQAHSSDGNYAHTGARNYAHTGARNYAHTGAPQKKERQLKTGAPAMEQSPSAECESLSLSSDGGVTYRDICDAYESNSFGTITALTSELIKDDMDTYTAEWCLDAMKIAVKRGKRNWAYVSGVLKNWQAEGRDDKQQAQPVGVTVGGTVDWWE